MSYFQILNHSYRECRLFYQQYSGETGERADGVGFPVENVRIALEPTISDSILR